MCLMRVQVIVNRLRRERGGGGGGDLEREARLDAWLGSLPLVVSDRSGCEICGRHIKVHGSGRKRRRKGGGGGGGGIDGFDFDKVEITITITTTTTITTV